MDMIQNGIIGLVLILVCSCFIKLFTVLSICRIGLGLQGIAFSVVTIALSLALTLLIMRQEFNNLGVSEHNIPKDKIEKVFRPFVQANAKPAEVERLVKLLDQKTGSQTTKTEPSFELLTVAFLLSQIKEAFELGLLLLIPFVLIDLLILHLHGLLGLNQASPLVFSLPLKLLLFLSVDGWGLLTERLIKGYL